MDNAKHTQFGGVNAQMGRQDGSYKYNLDDMNCATLVKYSIEQETNSIEKEAKFKRITEEKDICENSFEGDLIVQIHFINRRASTDPQKCFLEAIAQLLMNGKAELPGKLFVAQQANDNEPQSHA